MHYEYYNDSTKGHLLFHLNEEGFGRAYQRDKNDRLLTIIWNRGEDQQVEVDGTAYELKKDHIMPMMMSQSFHFSKAEDIIAWQFNRDFYCIIDHDHEVSCAGILFYGFTSPFFLSMRPEEWRRLDLLSQVFIDEFMHEDNVQEEMLRMLLKRLIIILTRMTKQQIIEGEINTDELDLVRRFNLLVEKHFKVHHKVQEYADLLNKSPKTLSNLFSIYHHRSPLQLIHDRIALEAKRLLIYTDLSSKEIAYELGFSEVPHFSRFFKKQLGQTPSSFREIKHLSA